MPEEFDFAELRKYLRGQIDMGDSEVFLDEPWTLEKRATPAPSRPAPASPAQFTPAINNPAINVAPSKPAINEPAINEAPPLFESPVGAAIKSDVVYANVADLVLYEGPANPKVLLLLPAPPAQPGSFFATPAGEMLVRLFGSLSIPADSIGVTFFYKGRTARNIPALLEASLRKMLAKEISFIAPSVMVTFGEPLFHQVFGKGKNFEEHAGTDMEFSGVKTCSLVDAYAMSQDKQLKWVTWKVHIPKSSYFKA